MFVVSQVKLILNKKSLSTRIFHHLNSFNSFVLNDLLSIYSNRPEQSQTTQSADWRMIWKVFIESLNQNMNLQNFPSPFLFSFYDSTLFVLWCEHQKWLDIQHPSVYNEKCRDLWARSLSEATEWKLNWKCLLTLLTLYGQNKFIFE